MYYDSNLNNSPITRKMDTTFNNSGLQDLRIFDKPASFRPLSDQIQSENLSKTVKRRIKEYHLF